MKKLFYVILVAVLLMVISSFVKKNLRDQAVQTQETLVVEEKDCDCNAERTCDADDKICHEKQIACGCEPNVAADAEDGVEVVDVDIEEDNPDDTQDEGETIIKE